MDWLNYHHLLYFWVIAREGSIKQARDVLSLSQPALSAQLRALEDAIGEKLFSRVGRKLVLTDVGKVVYRYADEIFSLGRELTNTLKGHGTQRPIRLVVGIAEVVPKMVAYKLLKVAYKQFEHMRIVCWEGRLERLLGELALHTLDIVLTDTPVPPIVSIEAHSHLLGESGVALFGPEHLASHYRRKFPQSLDGAPFLLPTPNSMLRRGLDEWFRKRGVEPFIVGEFEDGATMQAFAQEGHGLFPGSSVVESEISRQYQVRKVGHVTGVKQRFYGITVERRLKHPAVLAISESAKEEVFR
ncbi:MAG: transcriptional activator NhaR [Nitrospira sp. SB0677_bin_15]|nr:transcriptional activator NhaR [Nitrospira sp. SB0667_bin_9]MYD32052.1 transcriptional activator NhaR [Nitrospira sp. SB0661_bin_20]MYG41205.1 transcriptional activator NhaR [Nitrospira sp. SB0677_bin_15]MYJ23246.1 transcriptional activator NhaR [Nitrospira sp. SB0673_bin_12]